MEQEARFGAVLEATRSARHEQSGLVLIDGEGRARVRLGTLKPHNSSLAP
jgi:heat shock protein HslJ